MGPCPGVAQGTSHGIVLAHAPAMLLASLEADASSSTTIVTDQPGNNGFHVDFTFNGPDGSQPTAALVQDSAGNLYGATSSGGYGFGVVFKLDRTHHETVLHAFTGPDGATPYGALVLDGFGNIYGTTSRGGDADLGTVFKIDSQGVETVLHSFTGVLDGANPYAGLVMDNLGNLYGTTEIGGAFSSGTLFKIDTNGNETVLHSFAGGLTDGADPKARLILDPNGNLYGTTYLGGSGGYGTVFKLDATNTETILYNFTGGFDGGNPFGGVTLDTNGVLYGTTETASSIYRPYGCCKGNVFTLKGNQETVLYTFTGGNDGGTPASDLILYNGLLYGTTLLGGPSQKGTVFSVVVATGSESVLHGFQGKSDGGAPQGGLLMDSAGILYGTAQGGGNYQRGTVFQQQQ
jgi:uncharacterized repeat protein (TIGR03803 family)